MSDFNWRKVMATTGSTILSPGETLETFALTLDYLAETSALERKAGQAMSAAREREAREVARVAREAEAAARESEALAVRRQLELLAKLEAKKKFFRWRKRKRKRERDIVRTLLIFRPLKKRWDRRKQRRMPRDASRPRFFWSRRPQLVEASRDAEPAETSPATRPETRAEAACSIRAFMAPTS